MPITKYGTDGNYCGKLELDCADELIIANILETLKNPLIFKLMSHEEVMMLAQAAKNHALERAEHVLNLQNRNSKNKAI